MLKPDIIFRGQSYWKIGIRPYRKTDGTIKDLIEIRTFCPDCNSEFFIVTTPWKIEKKSLNRRCEECRKKRKGRVSSRKGQGS